ncbi:MAG: ABC transporter ATP-binding protein [Nitrospirota bacterium]
MMSPRAAQPIFRLERVTVAYGATSALREATFDVADGAMTAVIGSNGSGKSTALRVLAGLIEPTSGAVIFAGAPLQSLTPRERARRIAYVPQDTTIPFEFSVREIVAMGRSPYISAWGFESPDDQTAIDHAVALMDLGPLVDRSILDVSGGERQRAVIARALAQRPSVLLLDEPGANLDLKHQIALHALLARLNREEGLTTVTVSHDLNAVADSGHVIALKHGRIHAMGPPDAVLTETMVADVFTCRALIDAHPRTGRPRVTMEWTE